jgi:CRISPR-associated protein Csm2
MKKLDEIMPEEIVALAEEKGKQFADSNNGIKTNQIRNFYSAINSIRQKVNERNKFRYNENEDDKKYFSNLETQINTELILLEPKLAYAAGRQKVVKPFYELIKEAIDAYKQSKDKDIAINNFITLIESIVAYHKFYGGRDN